MSLIGERIETTQSLDTASWSGCTEGCVRRIFKAFVTLEPASESPGEVELLCPVGSCEEVVNIDIQLRDDGGTIPVGIRFRQNDATCPSGLVG